MAVLIQEMEVVAERPSQPATSASKNGEEMTPQDQIVSMEKALAEKSDRALRLWAH